MDAGPSKSFTPNDQTLDVLWSEDIDKWGTDPETQNIVVQKCLLVRASLGLRKAQENFVANTAKPITSKAKPKAELAVAASPARFMRSVLQQPQTVYQDSVVLH